VDGLQVGKSASTATDEPIVNYWGLDAGAIHWISNCHLKQAGNNGVREPVVNCADGDLTLYLWNSVLYGTSNYASTSNAALLSANSTAVSAYNCVFVSYAGVNNAGGGTPVLKNCYAAGQTAGTAYYGSPTLTYCASNDTTAGSANGCVSSVALDTDTFISTTDFHVAADGASPLQGAGNAPGGSAPLNYTTDIDGQTVATWCIGVDGIAATAQFARPSSDVAGGILYFDRTGHKFLG